MAGELADGIRFRDSRAAQVAGRIVKETKLFCHSGGMITQRGKGVKWREKAAFVVWGKLILWLMALGKDALATVPGAVLRA